MFFLAIHRTHRCAVQMRCADFGAENHPSSAVRGGQLTDSPVAVEPVNLDLPLSAGPLASEADFGTNSQRGDVVDPNRPRVRP